VQAIIMRRDDVRLAFDDAAGDVFLSVIPHGSKLRSVHSRAQPLGSCEWRRGAAFRALACLQGLPYGPALAAGAGADGRARRQVTSGCGATGDVGGRAVKRPGGKSRECIDGPSGLKLSSFVVFASIVKLEAATAAVLEEGALSLGLSVLLRAPAGWRGSFGGRGGWH
jgi:hypothetical protein